MSSSERRVCQLIHVDIGCGEAIRPRASGIYYMLLLGTYLRQAVAAEKLQAIVAPVMPDTRQTTGTTAAIGNGGLDRDAHRCSIFGENAASLPIRNWEEPSMNPTITTFERFPDRGKGVGAGHARALGARGSRTILRRPSSSFAQMKEPEHRTRHLFAQIPTYEAGGLVLFETGAIVLHIAEQHAGLLPNDGDARARASVRSAPGVGSKPNTLRPPYSCDRLRSSAMKASSEGPVAVASSRRACSSSRRMAASPSSRPSFAFSTAFFITAIV